MASATVTVYATYVDPDPLSLSDVGQRGESTVNWVPAPGSGVTISSITWGSGSSGPPPGSSTLPSSGNNWTLTFLNPTASDKWTYTVDNKRKSNKRKTTSEKGR